MAKHHRIFISFAIEDRFARDNLAFQAKSANTPFEFTDMSVKKPWDSSWKTNCRARIRCCDGFIAFLSIHTLVAEGALWEIKTAKEEGIPILVLYTHKDMKVPAPPVLNGYTVKEWTWQTVSDFLKGL